MLIRWSVFRSDEGFAVIPQTPMLIRLRQMVSDAFFGQEVLRPLKNFLDTNFIIGPVCILSAAYLAHGSFWLAGIGIASLVLSAIYWFASHWLCGLYLRYRGFTEGPSVEAEDFEAARVLVT